MKSTAAGLAALGRGPDSMLVHMSPREVAGLQQLAMAHGGSLTTNPHTGLPEAGALDNLLPMVLGIALTPVLGPVGAGLAVGGLQTARTGDIGKGLLAGLGAYGGAGLGEAAGASGLFGGAEAAGAGTLNTAAGITPPSAGSLSGIGLQSPTAVGAPPMGDFSLAGGSQGLAGATPIGLQQPASSAALGAGAGTGTSVGLQAGSGVADTLGQKATPSFMQALGQQFPTGMSKAAAGIGAIGALGGFEQPQLDFLAPQQQPSNYRAQAMNRRPYDPERNLFTDYGQLQPVYAAKGGAMHSVPQLEDGGFVLTKKAVDGLGKGDNERGQRAARAGLGAIPIKGPGTGTSDSIATSIDGVRPAKVSNGEAYVPSKRVKQAGGAKKLYALMRKAEQDAKRRAA